MKDGVNIPIEEVQVIAGRLRDRAQDRFQSAVGQYRKEEFLQVACLVTMAYTFAEAALEVNELCAPAMEGTLAAVPVETPGKGESTKPVVVRGSFGYSWETSEVQTTLTLTRDGRRRELVASSGQNETTVVRFSASKASGLVVHNYNADEYEDADVDGLILYGGPGGLRLREPR